MHSSKAASANLLLDVVLIDTVDGSAIVLAAAVVRSCVQCLFDGFGSRGSSLVVSGRALVCRRRPFFMSTVSHTGGVNDAVLHMSDGQRMVGIVGGSGRIEVYADAVRRDDAGEVLTLRRREGIDRRGRRIGAFVGHGGMGQVIRREAVGDRKGSSQEFHCSFSSFARDCTRLLVGIISCRPHSTSATSQRQLPCTLPSPAAGLHLESHRRSLACAV